MTSLISKLSAIGLSLSLIGVSVPAYAKNQSETVKIPATSSKLIAQSGLKGQWVLQYSVNGTIYQSVLRMKGTSGVMVTQYYDPQCQCTQKVQQTMRLKSSAHGLLILGYNPRYAGTNKRHPTYQADNFLYQITPYGERKFVTCDDGGQCSPVEIIK